MADTAQFLSEPHEKPFFLNIGFFETHRDEIGRFRNHPPDRVRGVEVPPYLPDTPESRQEAAELQGSVKHLDTAVGAILDVVRQQGLLHDTWVIFTTDHGIAMPRAKCTLYDPGIETALLMLAEPFGLVGGRVIRDLISHVDLTPTILDALGLPIPDRLQGRSYWPLLQGEPYTPRQHIFAEKTYHTAYEPQRAIRTERYKLIANLEVDIINVPADIQHSPIYPQMIDELTDERPPLELYDLMEDPLERDNLTGDPAHAEIQRALTQTLLAWMEETNDPILRGPIPSPYYHRAMRLLGGDS
ncbi:MAG: sulfatase-like hydrolase/transferase [Chloroflexi bacterium]|nr:sulfatase-like hydrolase/transferase [Chloroflexota bacterium]